MTAVTTAAPAPGDRDELRRRLVHAIHVRNVRLANRNGLDDVLDFIESMIESSRVMNEPPTFRCSIMAVKDFAEVLRRESE